MSLIRAAKRLNLKTIVIDPNADAPGKDHADQFFIIKPDDYEGTRKVAVDYSADAIITSQMENPLILMARLAEDLGFLFPGTKQILNCRNKYLMKQVLMEHQIPCARGVVLSRFVHPTHKVLRDFKFPVVIKPLDAHSSRGVFIIDSPEEINKYEKIARSFSDNGELLLEEYITGKEYSVESLTFNYRTEVIQITEKFITPIPYTVELGHLQPADVSEGEKSMINQLVKKTVKAFELDNCATHAELKMTDSGPVIIEIAARLGGDYISSLLTLSSTGIDMDEALIRISLGEIPDLSAKENRFSYIKYLELKPGSEIRKIKNWQEIFQKEGLVHAGITIKEGQEVPEITDSSKRTGFVLVSGRSRAEVMNKADLYLNRLNEYIILN